MTIRLHLLARNALLNFAGHAAPLAAALVAIPFLARSLGTERFGMLSLAWVLVGYFSLFDLGLGRALTHAVAQGEGSPDPSAIPGLVRKGLAAMLALGLAAGAVMFLLAPWLCINVLRVSAPLTREAIVALQVLAVCLPFVTVTAGLRGVLEAKQRFGWVNAIRIPVGLLTFLGPMAVAVFDPGLVALAAALAFLRLGAALVHWLVCALLYPQLFKRTRTSQNKLRALFSFGAWLTVSNIVGPLMVYFDRFVLSATLGLSAVAYYSAPYEVITRLWLIPAALTAVIFPALTSHLISEPQRALHLYRWSLKCIFVAIYPLALLLVVLASEWLGLWLGHEYASNSAEPARLLVIGVAVNCLAHVPFTLLQSAGRADLTAKLHLVEFPIYFALLLWLVNTLGITGAALAWSLRCLVDAAVLFWLAKARLPRQPALLSAAQLSAVGSLLALLSLSALPLPESMRWPLLLVALLLFALLGWFILLSPPERDVLRLWLSKKTLSNP